MNTTAQNPPCAPVNLRCEYLINPLGIDQTTPRLYWQVNDSRRGAVQWAYQVMVSSSEEKLDRDEADLWECSPVRLIDGPVLREQLVQLVLSGREVDVSNVDLFRHLTYLRKIVTRERSSTMNRRFLSGLLQDFSTEER